MPVVTKRLVANHNLNSDQKFSRFPQCCTFYKQALPGIYGRFQLLQKNILIVAVARISSQQQQILNRFNQKYDIPNRAESKRLKVAQLIVMLFRD